MIIKFKIKIIYVVLIINCIIISFLPNIYSERINDSSYNFLHCLGDSMDDKLKLQYHVGYKEEYLIDSDSFYYGNSNYIYVDDNAIPPGNGSIESPFNKIQDAINISGKGDIIFVFNGVYTEFINIRDKENLFIKGEDEKKTIIDGNYSGDCVNIYYSNDISIMNFTIRNSGNDVFDTTLDLYAISYCIISNISLTNCNNSWAICLNSCHSNTIRNCTISKCDHGILLQNTNYFNDIHNCKISTFGKYLTAITLPAIGIGFDKNSYNNTISGNTIYENSIGILIENDGCGNNTIQNNIIKNNKISGIIIIGGFLKNFVYLNDFINNGPLEGSIPKFNAFDFGNSKCQWYESNSGNYWSDYKGIDEDNDGIGDTSYRFINNIDIYPLISSNNRFIENI